MYDNKLMDMYSRDTDKYPPLAREEEFKLAKDYFENGNKKAAEDLIKHNLKIVMKIAYEFIKNNNNINILDLVQEGNMGLFSAVKHFNPYKNVKFCSYAVWWIRCYMSSYVMKNRKIIKPLQSNAFRAVYEGRFYKEKQKVLSEGKEFKYKNKTINSSKVTKEELEYLDKTVGLPDLSIENLYSENYNLTGTSGFSLPDQLLDNKNRPDIIIEDKEYKLKVAKELSDKLKGLSEQDRDVFLSRALADNTKSSGNREVTLSQLGKKYGNVSREAIRLRENRIKERLSKSSVLKELASLRE